MDYSEIIFLKKGTSLEADEIGNYSPASTISKKCYAKKQSVKSNEFYNAVETGRMPTCEFVIKRLNYSDEEFLEWNGEEYSIIRTADPKNKFDIVLICEKKISNYGE